MSHNDNDHLLGEQIEYYRARAGEYDDWFLRRDRYDRGPQLNQQWFDEVEQVRQALHAFRPAGDVLEFASGTGLWTEQLLPHASHITAVDAAAETIALNQARVRSERVQYVLADIFTWQPPRQYDVVFFGFWLSHVPVERFAPFWELVRKALKPAGRVFFVDSRYEPTSTALDHRLEQPQSTTSTRKLKDGRTYQIVKIFYEPHQLETRLAQLGWHVDVQQTAHYYIFGAGNLSAS
ncbi:MAG: class I SAM-dependent methyltransferase [Chloroflexi bacterium]|nr:class I SAM-dependent methyltransferase [Chloroflexota bacterium]